MLVLPAFHISWHVSQARHLWFLIAKTSSHTVRSDAEPRMLQKSKSITDYICAVARRKAFTGAVLVTEMGETLFRAAFGMANIELQVPNTPETKFRIGSITKPFTAMMVMLLVEEAKLSLEDRLVDRLPELPPRWSDIHIKHLLNHTSGLMHSFDLSGFREKVMMPYPVGGMAEEIRDKPLLFVPGECWHYSGIGYFLLARIIERVSGQTFEAALTDAIFEPLGMTDSGVDSHISIIPRRAAGYRRVAGVTQNAPFIHMPNLAGGGNLYSTIDDLARWDHALTAGSFISADSYRAMYTPGPWNYGYGWMVSSISGATVLEHGGGVNGFRGHFRRIPERSSSIIILSNDEDTDSYLMEMVGTVHELLCKVS